MTQDIDNETEDCLHERPFPEEPILAYSISFCMVKIKNRVDRLFSARLVFDMD